MIQGERSIFVGGGVILLVTVQGKEVHMYTCLILNQLIYTKRKSAQSIYSRVRLRFNFVLPCIIV